MNKYIKVALFGFLTWIIPFIVSIIIFPLRESQRPLFESIMPVVVTLATVLFAILYLRQVKSGFLKEGLLLGLFWLVINLFIDLLLFSAGPMQMAFIDYMKDIGLTYLIIPFVAIGFGYVLEWLLQETRTAGYES